MYKRMRKISASLVALAMCMSIFATAFAQDATNSKSHWAEQKMQRWAELGIIKGSESGDLRPDDNITRAEVATIINNMFGLTTKSSIQFSDVKEGVWYAGELLKAREAGYYKGYPGNISKAESKISREDAAVMITNVFSLDTSKVTNLSSLYKDEENISAYALAAVNKLSGNGVIKGYSDGNFFPKSNITRAEFIAIIDNLVKIVYNNSGTYGSKGVLGNVIVSSPSIELMDMSIDGNLYLTEGIGDGSATLNNVTVSEMTYISGGRDNIKIDDSKLNLVIVSVKNRDTNLTLTGTSKISNLLVNSPVKIQVDENSKVTLEIKSDDVEINGQKVVKGVAIVENGLIKQNISESATEIPAVAPSNIPSSTPIATPTTTYLSKNESNKSSSNDANKTPTPTVTLTSTVIPTVTPTMTATPTIIATMTPKATFTTTSTTMPTSTPTPMNTELKLESATADNLKEVVLKFNKPLTNISEAENVENYVIGDIGLRYEIFSNSAINAELSSDKMTVTVLLRNEIRQHGSIKVTIKSNIGLTEDRVVILENVKDITIPEIAEVTVTGNSLLKVTFSEPVEYATSLSNYKIDDLFFGSHQPLIYKNGKVVLLQLTRELSIGTHRLVINNKVCDYASFHIENNEKEFAVYEDTSAPTGIVESATQTKVIIKFDEEVKSIDIDDVENDTGSEIDSIDLADDKKTLTVNFDIGDALRDTGGNIIIKNLTDYSGNMVEFKIFVAPVCDRIRPEFVGYTIAENQTKIILEFSEPVYYFGDFKLTDEDGLEVDLQISGFFYNGLSNEYERNKLVLKRPDYKAFDSKNYTLRISKVEDLTPLRNEIEETEVAIYVCDQIVPYIYSISKDSDNNKIYVRFDEKVDKNTAESKSKYSYTLDNHITYYLNEDNVVRLLPDEMTVCIEFNKDKVDVDNIVSFQVEFVTDLVGNKMYTTAFDETQFEIIGNNSSDVTKLEPARNYSKIFVDYNKNKLFIVFDEKVDKSSAESRRSYIYTLRGVHSFLNSDTTATLLYDGKTVCIEFPKNNRDIDEIGWIPIYYIESFQIDAVTNLKGEKIPQHTFAYFDEIYEYPEIISAKVTGKNTILVKISAPINENTLSPSDFEIMAGYIDIDAWDAEYDSEKLEIKLTVNADLSADGTYEGISLWMSLNNDDMCTENIFGRRLKLQHFDDKIRIGDAFKPTADSVTSAVYRYGKTEITIELSEDLDINSGEEIFGSDLRQFEVKVDGLTIPSVITYHGGYYFDINERARFEILIDGNYSGKDVQVIFNPYDTATIFDKAGNELQAFNIWSKVK